MSVKHLVLLLFVLLAWPGIALAGGGGGHAEHAINWLDFSHWFGDNPDSTPPLVAIVFNFSLMAVIVFILLRKSLGKKFRARQENLRQSLDEAQKAKEEAEKALQAAQQKLNRLEQEMADVRQSILDAGEKQSAHGIDLAQRRAEQMRLDTKAMLDQEMAKLVETIRHDLAEEIVTAATRSIQEQISAEDQIRLSQDSMTSMENKDMTQSLGRYKMQ